MSADNQQQGQQQPPQPGRQEARQERRGPQVATFTVELGDQKNSGLITIDTLKLRLRAAWIKSNFYATGGGTDLGDMNRMPDIPGVRLTVDPRKSSVLIHDPLTDDKPLFDKIKKVLEGNDDYVTLRVVGNENQQPTPTAEHKLDEHELKSLMLEIARAVYAPANVRTMVAMPGSRVPTEAELADYPGEEIYDPWNSSADKPRFKKDVAAWRRRIEAQPA